MIDCYKGKDLYISFLYDDSDLDLNFLRSIPKLINSTIEVHFSFCDVRIVPEYKEFLNSTQIFYHNLTLYKEHYFRLLIPNVITASQALCLDGDTLFRDDISDLLETPLSSDLLMKGVKQLIPAPDYRSLLQKERKEYQYIGIGVYLINVNMARKMNYVSKAIELYHTSLPYISSIVNYLGYGKIGYLPLRYHIGKEILDADYKEQRVVPIFSNKEIEDALHSPAIIHYSGKLKPLSGNTDYCVNIWKSYWRQIFER